MGIMRPWIGLGVVLDRKGRTIAQGKSFNGLVVQVDVGQFQMRCRLGLFQIHRKPVILRGDFGTVLSEVQDRMVGAPMSVVHLEGIKTCCPGQQLMT